VSVVAGRARCRATAFVTNALSASVSTIDVKTRTKHPSDIPVGTAPGRVAVTPNGKTAFVSNFGSGTVSTIDVKTRTKHPADIPVGTAPYEVAITPDGKTAFVSNFGSNTVSTIDVKSRTKDPADIPVGAGPKGVAVTPDGKTAFVLNGGGLSTFTTPPATVGDTVSTIDVKTRTKHPADITVPPFPLGVAVTPDGKTAFVTHGDWDTVSTIDVKTRKKHPTDILVGAGGVGGVAITSDGKTAFVTNGSVGREPILSRGTVSTIDVKTRKKNPADITVGQFPFQVAVTPCRR
jgi:YVTN family beta-propeller protein